MEFWKFFTWGKEMNSHCALEHLNVTFYFWKLPAPPALCGSEHLIARNCHNRFARTATFWACVAKTSELTPICLQWREEFCKNCHEKKREKTPNIHFIIQLPVTSKMLWRKLSNFATVYPKRSCQLPYISIQLPQCIQWFLKSEILREKLWKTATLHDIFEVLATSK